MADTWGDIVSRNYSAGRAIGDDIASTRFARKADKVRASYEEKAAAEGKTLQDYLPDLEKDLRRLAADVGATRRGVTDRRGAALDMSAMGRIRDDVSRAGDVRAGALALKGDQAGARQTRAGAQYAIGEFDAGQGQQIAGDTIAATQGAVGADGKYDAQQGALGLAKVGAQYGNAEAAAGQTEAADTFRMKSAAAKATQLYNVISNPQAADPDQVRGLWEGLKEDVPEFKNVDIQLQDGKIYLYEGGKVTGDLDPQEAAQLLQTAIQAPGQAIQSSMQAQLKAVEDSKATRKGVDDKVLDASLKVVESLKAAGIPDTVTSAALAAQKAAASTSGGWQLQDIGSEPGTFLMQKNGQVYTIKTNVTPNLEMGETGGTLQVFDAEGNPVPGDVLNKRDADLMQQSLTDLAVAKAQVGTEMNFEVVGQQLRILNELGAAYGGSQVSRPGSSPGALKGAPGGGTSRAERNNNPGNIEDRGQFEGTPGYLGSDGRFAKFATLEAGQKAFENQLTRYFDGKTTGQPLQTVEQIVSTWSPQNDPTNQAGSTDNYAAYVAKKLGVSPDTPLTKADIPRLTVAMAEFERGGIRPDTPAKQGAIAASQRMPTPSRAAAVAQSAPTQQTRVPGRKAAITSDFVRKQANDLTAARDTYLQQKDALARFDRDHKVELRQVPGPTNASLPRTVPVNLPPNVAAVRERLAADLATSEQELVAINSELKQNTGALNRETAARSGDKEAQALYARYGGSADFFSRAGQGGSR